MNLADVQGSLIAAAMIVHRAQGIAAGRCGLPEQRLARFAAAQEIVAREPIERAHIGIGALTRAGVSDIDACK